MRELEKEELYNINGGIAGWAVIGIVAAVIFLIGVLDGYTRPLGCNK